ncbi:MAG TPA: I78 family peptidase inhibitor [Amaricoccus sp.]|uniref:I78 family peptidase inhibitor n=1 Tax=Amaricoccus sp. TaxID=1872485 RepID=UPI002BB12DAE|nr:I78 family peptidase inhibitor [Amaricoccus sp.]HMQ92003.1 I78 family peptidase inhibitor [Amaricoccus sp.]HMR53753.1 I78 family peptidase inhibitor [Amaricoccus sp.]HMR60878.1 I78 family peptidase inhibitor [Amaricoccus sp.]HMU00742.1 I78 family peptidase inhibitor [Amaricoccus sp.]
MSLQAPRSALILLLALGACNQIPGAAVPEGPAEVVAGDGSCGAEAYQAYVGQRIDALNDVALPDDKRVLFPTTPATMDFVPGRLNIAVDKSDTISKIYCG